MTFLDMRLMRSAQQPSLSIDGKWMLYALSLEEREGPVNANVVSGDGPNE